MTDLVRWLAGALGGLLFVLALLGGVWLHGRHAGATAADTRHREALAAIDAEMQRQQAAQHQRAGKLAAEVERLRRRPETIRTVTTEVVRHVVADAECKSLPESLRVLWGAGSADPDPASAAGMGDAALPRVADARR